MQSPEYANRPAHEKAAWYSPSAEAYLRARPPYPPALVRAVAAVAQLGRETDVLEIGSGPGTATREFCPAVGSIVCVEPNAEFVALARRELAARSNVSFVCDTFEEADVQGPFDAIVAATSFHWVDGEKGVECIRSLLRPGGHVVLLWNKEPHPVAAQARDVVGGFERASFPLPAVNRGRTEAVATLAALAQPLTKQGFEERILCHTETDLRYDLDTFVALHQSFSPFLALPEEERELAARQLLQELAAFAATGIETTYVSVGQVFRLN